MMKKKLHVLVVVVACYGVSLLLLSPFSAYAAPLSQSSGTLVGPRTVVMTKPGSSVQCQALLSAYPQLAHTAQGCKEIITVKSSAARQVAVTPSGCPIYDESASEVDAGIFNLWGSELDLQFSYSTCTNVNVNIYWENCNGNNWGYLGFSVANTNCTHYVPTGFSPAYAEIALSDFTVSRAGNSDTQWNNIQCDGGASGFPGFWVGNHS